MFYETCNGYKVIHRGSFDDDAPAVCRKLELERNDGYSVVAIRDGKIVADGEGWFGQHYDGQERVEAAKYAHACGYVD